MSSSDLGSWQPLDLPATVELFSAAQFRWWISGGRALELHLGRTWRTHEDTDVGVTRSDLNALPPILSGWDVHVAATGTLTRWDGQPLDARLHQNNLWCRRDPNGPWLLDVTIGDGNDDFWIYRRDPTVQVRWDHAVLQTTLGVPYLAPDLQLLYKSTHVRPKDTIDAGEVIPELDTRHRVRLAQLLPDEHPWHRLLR